MSCSEMNNKALYSSPNQLSREKSGFWYLVNGFSWFQVSGGLFQPIVRHFFSNNNIMHMAFTHAGCTDFYKPCFFP